MTDPGLVTLTFNGIQWDGLVDQQTLKDLLVLIAHNDQRVDYEPGSELRLFPKPRPRSLFLAGSGVGHRFIPACPGGTLCASCGEDHRADGVS